MLLLSLEREVGPTILQGQSQAKALCHRGQALEDRHALCRGGVPGGCGQATSSLGLGSEQLQNPPLLPGGETRAIVRGERLHDIEKLPNAMGRGSSDSFQLDPEKQTSLGPGCWASACEQGSPRGTCEDGC